MIFLILKRTSVLYYFIYNLQCSPVAFIKTELEKDLNIHIRDQLWHFILGQLYNIAVCVRNMLIQFKIMGSTGPDLSRRAYMQRWTQPVEGAEVLLVQSFTGHTLISLLCLKSCGIKLNQIHSVLVLVLHNVATFQI